MKTLHLLLALTLAATCPLRAQEPAIETPAPFPAVILAPEQLDQLLAPIALYPDALIALILPASTVPADIVLAARYLKENPGNLSQVEHRAWDDSVKSLTHYPEVLQWLDENLTWTKQVGEAFSAQPADVMNAIQRLRTKAQANGALASTPQQQVLAEPDVIRIVPADPEYIYVPRYDPSVVFVDRPLYYSYPYAPLITFGVGWRVGSWLAYDFDWHRCSLWIGDRHRRWPARHDWHRPLVPIGPVNRGHAHVHPPARQWQPPRWHRPPSVAPSPGTRPHPYPPASSANLARTYGRTNSVPGASDPYRPPPSVTRSPTPMDMDLTSRTYRSDSYPRPPGRPAVVNRTTPTRQSPESNVHVRDGQRSGRNWPVNGNPAPSTRVVPTAPALSVVGPISSDRPTVVAPPQTRASVPHLGHSAGPTRIAPQSRVTISPPAQTRTYSAPPAPPPTHVAPPAAAPSTPQPAPPPAGRPSQGSTRGHSRARDLP